MDGTQLVPGDGLRPISSSLDPVKAREMQVAKVETYRAKRAEGQKQRHQQAQAVLGSAVDAAQSIADSRQLEDYTIEQLADMEIRRMAKVVLLGGPAFAPVSLKEATDVAHTWSQVAKNESIRKGKTKEDTPEQDSPVEAAARQLRVLGQQLRKAQKGRAS